MSPQEVTVMKRSPARLAAQEPASAVDEMFRTAANVIRGKHEPEAEPPPRQGAGMPARPSHVAAGGDSNTEGDMQHGHKRSREQDSPMALEDEME